MKTGLGPKMIVSIENKYIHETNRFIKLPSKNLSFSKPNDDNLWELIMENLWALRYFRYEGIIKNRLVIMFALCK